MGREDRSGRKTGDTVSPECPVDQFLRRIQFPLKVRCKGTPQLSSKSRISEEEEQVQLIYAALRKACRSDFLRQRDTIEPDLPHQVISVWKSVLPLLDTEKRTWDVPYFAL